MVNNQTYYTQYFDCVLMLTWSDWHNELRSNRYHYASRFSKLLPVIFVQPDLDEKGYIFETVEELDNFTILHVSKIYGKEQSLSIINALAEKNIHMPLLWVYNVYFQHFISNFASPFRIYHATEDYFSETLYNGVGWDNIRDILINILQQVDLVIAVSSGVLYTYVQQGNYQGEGLVLTNGCDIDLWNTPPRDFELPSENEIPEKIVFYQGGINNRLDADLIHYLLENLADWEFWFAGNVDESLKAEWEKLLEFSNLKYLGKLHPEQVKDFAYSATVGIIPFAKDEAIVKNSFPLKAFEYIAVGLPVVSITIDELIDYANLIDFEDSYQGFRDAITRALSLRLKRDLIDARISTANLHDYDLNFSKILPQIEKQINDRTKHDSDLRVVFLYSDDEEANKFRMSLSKVENVKCRFISSKSNWWNVLLKFQISLGWFDAIILHDSFLDQSTFDLRKFTLTSSIRIKISTERQLESSKPTSNIVLVRGHEVKHSGYLQSEITWESYDQLITILNKICSAECHFSITSIFMRFFQPNNLRIFIRKFHPITVIESFRNNIWNYQNSSLYKFYRNL